ncbi:2-dehydro-3-deoxy-6-phosphogalactonate aldolase [Stutzerimonas nosocomialis]|uniref:2-dehydro-3-deoxy-6-phosphogalactonate aldolase n=1 Tax=Stutzerimonas nosocomialis TaxID=1056496 RepID=UPI00110991D5|nr:2-dehydro-3-deoxy-6-phosphogalactonate aldolase [Stutzerimonas nosocomialis]TLX57025.1 2-dehydro-3-deoxy-6-phosphogalactonate aldolase [Stutzerimonas nosocomialis]
MFETALAHNGLIAILRGLGPDEAEAVGQALYAAGVRIIEVPFNSPEPLRSIETLRRTLPGDCLVGAGTVLRVEQVRQLKDAGGQLVVMPHCDETVIRVTVAAGLFCTPGVATPGEAFAALAAGASALKVFPAEQVGPGALKAWLTVLPTGTALLPVGGITPEGMAPYLAAGAVGFGLGSALYRPGMSPAEVGRRAQTFIQARRSTAG